MSRATSTRAEDTRSGGRRPADPVLAHYRLTAVHPYILREPDGGDEGLGSVHAAFEEAFARGLSPKGWVEAGGSAGETTKGGRVDVKDAERARARTGAPQGPATGRERLPERLSRYFVEEVRELFRGTARDERAFGLRWFEGRLGRELENHRLGIVGRNPEGRRGQARITLRLLPESVHLRPELVLSRAGAAMVLLNLGCEKGAGLKLSTAMQVNSVCAHGENSSHFLALVPDKLAKELSDARKGAVDRAVEKKLGGSRAAFGVERQVLALEELRRAVEDSKSRLDRVSEQYERLPADEEEKRDAARVRVEETKSAYGKLKDALDRRCGRLEAVKTRPQPPRALTEQVEELSGRSPEQLQEALEAVLEEHARTEWVRKYRKKEQARKDQGESDRPADELERLRELLERPRREADSARRVLDGVKLDEPVKNKDSLNKTRRNLDKREAAADAVAATTPCELDEGQIAECKPLYASWPDVRLQPSLVDDCLAAFREQLFGASATSGGRLGRAYHGRTPIVTSLVMDSKPSPGDDGVEGNAVRCRRFPTAEGIGPLPLRYLEGSGLRTVHDTATRRVHVTSEACVAFAHRESSYDVSVWPAAFEDRYLPAYLLALHQALICQDLSLQSYAHVDSGPERKKSEGLVRDFLRYMTRYDFSVVSNHLGVQQVYRSAREVLGVDLLVEEVGKELEAWLGTEERQLQRQLDTDQKLLNSAAVLALLAGLATVVINLNLVELTEDGKVSAFDFGGLGLLFWVPAGVALLACVALPAGRGHLANIWRLLVTGPKEGRRD